MPTENNQNKQSSTTFERHAQTILASCIFAILAWNTYTTYNNSLLLTEINAKYATVNVQELERRVQRIEDTRWNENSQDKFANWVKRELDKKQDK